VLKPTIPSSFTSIFDPSSVLFWRLVLTLAAAGHILGWHLKLPVVGRVRV